MADGTVTAGADGDLEVAVAAEPDGSDDVVDVRGPEDHGRASIEHRVPDAPGIVVLGGVGGDDLAREGAAKVVQLGARGRVGTGNSHATSLARRAAVRRPSSPGGLARCPKHGYRYGVMPVDG